MLSKSSNHRFKCLECAIEFDITHWYKVDGNYEPHLKQAILDDSIFVARCPKCGSRYRLDQSIRYSELRSDGVSFHAYLINPDDIPKQREYIEMLPLHQMNGSRVHVVTSSLELQQIIKTYDSGQLPPETIIKPSTDEKKNAAHEESLKSMKEKMVGFQKEFLSGKLSPTTIAAINRGRKETSTNQESWWTKLLAIISGHLRTAPPSVATAQAPNPTKQPSASQQVTKAKKEPNKVIFHYCLAFPADGKPVDLSSIQIMAEAWEDIDRTDVYRYGATYRGQFDFIAVVEVDAATYWKKLFDNREVSPSQATAWIRDFEAKSKNRYTKTDNGILGETELLIVLTTITLVYLLTNFDKTKIVPAIKLWYEYRKATGKEWHRHKLVQTADTFIQCGSLSHADTAFTAHIFKNVDGLNYEFINGMTRLMA